MLTNKKHRRGCCIAKMNAPECPRRSASTSRTNTSRIGILVLLVVAFMYVIALAIFEQDKKKAIHSNTLKHIDDTRTSPVPPHWGIMMSHFFPWNQQQHLNLLENDNGGGSAPSDATYPTTNIGNDDGGKKKQNPRKETNHQEENKCIPASQTDDNSQSYTIMSKECGHYLSNVHSSDTAENWNHKVGHRALEDRNNHLATFDCNQNTNKFSKIVPKTKQKRAIEDAVNYYFTDEMVTNNATDDIFFADNLCYEYLLSFLEGITDAKDNCEGIKNAYTAAFCEEAQTDDADDDHDDYFVKYNQFSCCKSLKSHFNAYCDKSKIYAGRYLLIGAAVLLLCEVTKNMIRSQQLHWIPEVGGCIIVGLALGAVCNMMPDTHIDSYSFDEILFLHILLPPILFNAALSINKRQFCRFRLPIFMMAICGTIMSTFMTGYIVYVASNNISSVTSLPLLDSLLFGALISSTDSAAILSVLTSLTLSEDDVAYIMVIGESLLNDGVAITFFNSFVSHYNHEGIDTNEVFDNFTVFLYAGFGSIAIGLSCGMLGFLYFWLFHKKLNACMEVACFFLWAGLSYYASEEMHMSGIISIVTIGFFMDTYIISSQQKSNTSKQCVTVGNHDQASLSLGVPDDVINIDFSQFSDRDFCTFSSSTSKRNTSSYTPDLERILQQKEKFNLSKEAEKHVRFVSHLLAQLSENCIFVYLGLFLYSDKYEWQTSLMIVSIFACVLSRVIMVLIVCNLVWYINAVRKVAGCYKTGRNGQERSKTASILQNSHIQTVLVLSGLRGAVSFSLVESLPIYNIVTNEGTKYKGILKAMTSSSILFTIFILGGGSYYILKYLGINLMNESIRDQSSYIDIIEGNTPFVCGDVSKIDESKENHHI